MSEAEPLPPGEYEWRPPAPRHPGDNRTAGPVMLDGEFINALAAVERVFPEARATWYRVPGLKWNRT